jgi:hydrogenase maturation protease
MESNSAQGTVWDMPPEGRVVVLGLGNILQSDDGVGVHAVRHLRQNSQFADAVELVDGGTISFSLLELIETSSALIVLDAVRLDGDAGDVRVFEGADMDRLLARPLVGSVHAVSLSEVLDMARLRDGLPPRRALIGVLPQYLTWGDALSPVVKAALPRVAELVGQVFIRWRDAQM